MGFCLSVAIKEKGIEMKIKKRIISIPPRIIVGVVVVAALGYFGVRTFMPSQAIILDNINSVSVYEGVLPSRYNLREHVAMADHYQWPWGSCWSFATTRAIETYLELHNDNLQIDLSRLHPVYMMSEDFGGELSLENSSETGSSFVDYMLKYNDRGFGEVLEVEVPYSNEGYTDVNGTHAVYPYDENDYDYLYNLKPSAFVTNIVNYSHPNSAFSSSEIEQIKRHIMKNGSLYATTVAETSFYGFNYVTRNSDYTQNRYYDGRITGASVDSLVDHAYAIIGWDDNYPKEKFTGSARPSQNGAFIILNSDIAVDSVTGEPVYSTQIGYTSYEDMLISYNTFGISGATTDLSTATREVRFSNRNLYIALKESPSLKKMIVDTDDERQTLSFLKTFQNSGIVTTLDLSNHHLDSIVGLGSLFPYLTSINLSHCVLEGDYLNKIIKLAVWDDVDLSYTNITNQDIASLDKSRIKRIRIAGNQITSLAGLEGYGLSVDASDNPITARSLNLLGWHGGELEELIIDDVLASNAQISSFCNMVGFCTSVNKLILLNNGIAGVNMVAIPEELYGKYRKDKYYPNTILNYDSSAMVFDWNNRTISFTPSNNRNYYIEFYSERNGEQRYLLRADTGSHRAYSIESGDGQSYYKNSAVGIWFRGNGSISDFVGCSIDGNNINASQYTLSSDYTTIELSTELLESLSDGGQVLTMIWNDGEALAEFVVETSSAFDGVLRDNTGGGATITSNSPNSFSVLSDKACMVLWTLDGGVTWNHLSSMTVTGNNDLRRYSMGQIRGAEVVISYAGDVNNDHAVNVRDVRIITNAIMGKTSLIGMARMLADVDGRSGINVRDVRAIVNDIIGKNSINW